MDTTRFSCPVTNDDVYLGFAEVQGLIRLTENALVLEFQVKDSLLSVLATDVKEIRIPIEEIDSVQFRRSWFGFCVSLCVRARRMSTLSAIPGHSHGELRFSVARRDRARADELASQANLKISEMALRHTEAPTSLPAPNAAAGERALQKSPEQRES